MQAHLLIIRRPGYLHLQGTDWAACDHVRWHAVTTELRLADLCCVGVLMHRCSMHGVSLLYPGSQKKLKSLALVQAGKRTVTSPHKSCRSQNSKSGLKQLRARERLRGKMEGNMLNSVSSLIRSAWDR